MHSNADDATIVISRKRGGYRDSLRSYVIMVDGNPVGKIKRGQRVELPVSHGQHELFLKIGWTESRSITFDVQPGAVIEFFCEPGGPAAAALQDVAAGQYITLIRVPEAEYLIRPSSHDGGLVIHANSLAEVLIPRGYSVEPGAGSGDLHLQGAGFEVSFASEDAGWYVEFHGDISRLKTDEFVAQVARQVQENTGTSTQWVQIT